MSQPSRDARRLGGVLPPSFVASQQFSRRGFLRASAFTGLALGAPGLLAACGDDGGSGGGAGSTLTFGMNEAGDIPPAARLRAIAEAFAEAEGITVERNEVEHNTFQEQINTYLQGNPDDVFTWFAGYRMQGFAESGLISDVSDVWPIDGIADSFQEASTYDGKQYFVPQSYYPWAVFYRKSVFEKNGYGVPESPEDLTNLATKMQSDGITPFAFADKDGWPAMGTFDVLNMRINGFDFHMSLMRGEEAWNSDEVRNVFAAWRDLLPFHQEDPLGRTWQEAAQAMGSGECGMYLLGTFVLDAIPDVDPEDIDFFTFPALDESIGNGALDAPIDGFCMSADPDNPEMAKKFLAYLASAEAADIAADTGVPFIAANSEADTSKYSSIQLKSAELVQSAEQIAQFLDRDTDAGFASTVIIPALQEFLGSPDDIDAITDSIQSQAESIFVS